VQPVRHNARTCSTNSANPLCIAQGELQDTLNVQEGHIFDYKDIVDDRRRLEK
jgi:hypothetical protein